MTEGVTSSPPRVTSTSSAQALRFGRDGDGAWRGLAGDQQTASGAIGRRFAIVSRPCDRLSADAGSGSVHRILTIRR